MHRGCDRRDELPVEAARLGRTDSCGSSGCASGGRASDATDSIVVSVSATMVGIMDKFDCPPLVTVECVDGEAARGCVARAGRMGGRSSSCDGPARMPLCLPSQHKSSPTNSTSSSSPDANLRGSMSLKPTSSPPRMSFSNTPRNIFIACTLLVKSRDARTTGGIGSLSCKIHSRMPSSSPGVRSHGVSRANGRGIDSFAISSFRSSTRRGSSCLRES